MRREFSAGGVVFRQGPRGRQWLLVKPKDKNRWQLPKGLLDPGESTAEAALREVKEEGGVEVELIDKVDTIRIFFHWPPKAKLQPGETQDKVIKTIAYFLMEAVGETESGLDKNEIDEVIWLSFEKARARLTFKNEKEVLTKAKEMVE
jgi:8-oxo-dGTP pyrophosphatase MutT (NUDIX family)